MEYVLTEFFKIKLFSIETISERIIILNYKEIPKESFIRCRALEKIRAHCSELVKKIEKLELSTKDF